MIQSNEDFIKNYNEESNEGYFIEADLQYHEKSYELHNDLPFLPERMKVEKVKKLVTNLNDKNEFVIHIRNSKQPLSQRLILKKKILYRDKKPHNAWLKPDSFIVHLKTDDIYKDIAEDAKTRFDTSNFEEDIPLPRGKNKQVIGLMKDELG